MAVNVQAPKHYTMVYFFVCFTKTVLVCLTLDLIGGASARNRTVVRQLIEEMIGNDHARIPSDNVVLLDVSLSNFDGDDRKYQTFFKQDLKRFLNNTMYIHPDASRVAILTYANGVRVVADGISRSSTLYTACDLLLEHTDIRLDLQQSRTETNITGGLIRTEQVLRSGMRNRQGRVWKQNVWVFSDGHDAKGIEFLNATVDVANRLRKPGTDIYAVILPGSYATLRTLRPLVAKDFHILTFDEWVDFTHLAGQVYMKGNDTVYEDTVTTGNCSAFGEHCSENASCYCDCLRAVMRCACDPNTQPSHGNCADCPASLWKPQAGNHSCHRGSCIKQLYNACHGTTPAPDNAPFYITIAIASGGGVGLVAVAIFVCCYFISARKQRLRRDQTIQPPGFQELQTACSSGHGYANSGMLQFHPDVVRSTQQHQMSMRDAIHIEQPHGCNDYQLGVNTDNKNDYNLTPKSSKVLPSCSTNDAERPGESSLYVDPDMRHTRDSGYLKPVKPIVEEDDSGDYVNATDVTGIAVGQYLTPEVESSKHSITEETDKSTYVNDNELQMINASLQNLNSNHNSPKSQPVIKPRSQPFTDKGSFKPKRGAVEELKNMFAKSNSDFGKQSKMAYNRAKDMHDIVNPSYVED